MSQAAGNWSGSVYIPAITVGGTAVIAFALWTAVLEPPSVEWFLLAALTLFTGSFTVKVPAQAARLSVSETFVFTSTLLFGPGPGTLTAVLDALVMSFWLKKSSVSRVLFNVSAPAIAIWTSAQAFFIISGFEPGQIERSSLSQALGPLFVFALLYFVLNTGLVAGAVRTERNEPLLEIWVQNFAAFSINYFVGGSIALLLVAYSPRIDVTVLGVIVPILLITYFTFRTSMGRLEDATQHVAQLNDLYLSTIETLAMAVDAKDQITHGHIRRVQVYATALAKELGVSDDCQLKAIEAAALLHDMGKLAIPEHILNKPGKLTAGEFDKMKRHADIGADLLSSIPFPYPVVPIVRHHHENWDGTGYPNHIAGTDIPLGARILAVVDCFDALTSDRPYRPRLSTEEAFVILLERRGTMYDPLVVDRFAQVYSHVAPAAVRAGQLARTLLPQDVQHSSAKALDNIHRSAIESAALLNVRKALAGANAASDLLQIAAVAVREQTPATVIAFYAYFPQADILRCTHAVGDNHSLLTGLEIPCGERTTGWAAANGQTISNSAATLDLGLRRESFVPPLQSALAVPLPRAGQTSAGVLTLYSTLVDPFTEHHVYIAEQLATLVAEHLTRIGERRPEVIRFRTSRD